VPAVIAVAFITFLIWMLVGQSVGYSLARAISVLVISCPCALGLATPVAIMVGSGLSFKNGILFKNALSIENIKDAKYVILDKTGTITMGKPKVYSIVPFIDQAAFLSIIKSLEENSSHPLASAINEYKCSYEKKEVKDFKEIGGKGVSGIIDNKLAYGINLKYAKELINIDDSKLEIINDIAQSGKTPLIFILDNELIGIVAVADKIKEDSKTAIKNLKELGLIPIMLTGDNYITASSIAKEVEIDYFISDVLPIDKKDIVEKIKKNGSTIMVGDGINDALALTSADIGIAIGAGSDIAIDSADIVLVKSSLNDLVKTIRISREIVKNIKQNLFWAFFYNLIMIPIAFGIFYFTNNEYLVSLKPWYGALAMSFSSIFVVLNALRLNLFDANKHKNNRKIKEEDLLFIKNVITNKEENNMEKIVINVNGMMCMHCKKHVDDACLKIDGVSEANADLDKKNVTVSVTKNVAREDLVKSIIDAGYEAK
jgi:Cu2+-exporting ATPase